MQRKLKVDGSSLWDDPEDQFVLRFSDISEIKQKKLAERLMLTDKHSTIRNGEDTFADKILLLLKEINPIIYAEGQRSHGYADWRKWNKYNIYSLSGWSYQQLSKSIYKFLCVKKEKTINDLKDTLLLSMWGIKGNRNIYDRMTELIANLPETLQTQNLRPNEVGMEEVQNARFRAERNY